MKTGKVVAIRGVVVDIEFEDNNTPEIYEALVAPREKGEVVLEVQASIGEGKVRAVAMDVPYGVTRGAEGKLVRRLGVCGGRGRLFTAVFVGRGWGEHHDWL